ncbi:MAG: RNA 3'-terminal phosphate cyclase [Gemmatimonadota bacterium]
MIAIDGSHGEGGGQILRTALGLACLSGTAFRMFDIRRGRPRPGLSPQHLAAVEAARRICGARVSGDAPGSTELVFSPGGVRGGEIVLDVGTAGSAVLVLQTIIPALLFASGASEVVVSGGTHVPFSPCYGYAAGVFAPALRRLGLDIRLSIESYGFYPRGGGRIRARLFPAESIAPLRAVAPGRLVAATGESGVGNLPLAIAERQKEAALAKVRPALAGVRADVRAVSVPTPGQGTFIFLAVESEGGAAGFCALGARGKRAEAVGEEAARALLDHVGTGAALDPHLADQLVPYLAMSGGESEFTTSRVTPHLLTNLWAVGLFRPFRYDVDGELGKPGRVRIRP